ncbi:ABC transport system ATP-binding protein [Thermoplasma volcanium GSS1]|uniref:ABC transport system ATP-binding protein n=1 Tax=Thermoplasma volcanium (strain ATCC 51530 / DSM 4299 / JCM 9571 / NBRC 15438 / GSS1) TaxID=273116 RepID=Q97A47_THEVO|nr:ATP-binding cassette domain-containing protein [Thermoplasma volcanium]BAB60105.1 ABC transport system ATP-binding protein [Thermoplasma volcanium GSS1]
MPIIKTENLTKIYSGNIKAVSDLNIEIEEAEIYGLLGKNGAGKTTTIKMLTTAIEPTSGNAKVAGYDLLKDREKIRNIIGVVPQDLTTDADLKGIENLRMIAAFYDIPKSVAESRINDLLNIVDLTDWGNKYVSQYSGGMRKRLELICGLVNAPKILFLDEPTLGLDVNTRAKMWKYIRDIQKELGVTIILTSHYLEEVDELANRISIIDHGKILVTGTPDELKSSLKGDIITMQFSGSDEAEAARYYPNALYSSISGEDKVRIKVENSDVELPKILSYLTQKGISPLTINVKKPSLDEVFLEYTGSSIDEDIGPEQFRRMMQNVRRLR